MCSLYRSKYSNLKLAEATMGRRLGVVKRSGRDETIWVEIHICMGTAQGILKAIPISN
jgi:hypothetical protein